MANTTKFDTRNVVQKVPLARIAPGAGPDPDRIELDNVLASLNSQVTPLLEMRESSTPDLILNIGPIAVQDPEYSFWRTIPPISNLLPAITSLTVTFPAASGGSATPSAGDAVVITVASGNFIKCGLNLDANGNLVLQTGTEGASEAAATVPPLVPNTFPIGYVVLENQGGTIQNITNSAIYQYVGGGGGGSGSGDASSVLTRLWDQFEDSIYNQLTGVDFSIDQSGHVDGSSTGSYSLVSSSFEFASASQTLITTNLLSYDEFIGQAGKLGATHLTMFWSEDGIDSAATYEISVDGGSNWSDISADMERAGQASDTYSGQFDLTLPVAAVVVEDTTDDADHEFTEDRIAQQFTITSAIELTELRFNGRKEGSPTGAFTCTIHADSSGEPDAAVIHTSTTTLDVDSGVSAVGDNDFTFAFDNDVLDAGTYWVVIDGDATYDGVKSGAVNVTFRKNTGGSGFSTETASTWSVSGDGLDYSVSGEIKDVRVRITSSASDVSLTGYGLFYDPSAGVSQGAKNVKSFSFLSNSDNESQFDLGFYPDPDLLTVYWVEGGQAFRSPAFTISGTTIQFPADTFLQESDETVTLVAAQNDGISFDNSQQNSSDISSLNTETNALGNKTAAQDQADADLISVPHTDIVGRAPIRDLAKIPAPLMGIERILFTDKIEMISGESTSEGIVHKLVESTDIFDRVRLVGNSWTGVRNSYGNFLQLTSVTTTDYFEVTFYGTGINILGFNGSYDVRPTIDGGSEGTDIIPTGSGILGNRDYGPNQIFSDSQIQGLSLGLHTIKFRVNAGTFLFYGLEILNESTSISVPANSAVIAGEDRHLIPSNSLGFVAAADFDSASDDPTTDGKGGAVVVYSERNASGIVEVKQRFNAADSTQKDFTGTVDHSNEEVVQRFNWRQFGAGRGDDFSTLATSGDDRAFTLDDGTTTLVGSGVYTNTLGSVALANTGYLVLTFVGTGLDVLIQNSVSGVPDTITASIDGGSANTFIDSTLYPTLSTGAKVFPVVSGLPYGTHTVKFTQTVNVGFDPAWIDFIIYAPKKPSIPEDAGKLGSYYLMADFSPTSSGLLNISDGVLRKNSIREMVYTDSWSAIAQNSGYLTTGHDVISSGGAVEYTFFGTGFTTMFDTSGSISFQITIDGSITDFDTAGYTVEQASLSGSINTATGAYSGDDAAGSQFSIYGLPLGLHTVELDNSAGTGLVFNCIDVVTPVYSYNSSEQLLHDRLVGSNSIRSETGLPDFFKEKQHFPQGVDLGVDKIKVKEYDVSSRTTAGTDAYVFNGFDHGKAYRVEFNSLCRRDANASAALMSFKINGSTHAYAGLAESGSITEDPDRMAAGASFTFIYTGQEISFEVTVVGTARVETPKLVVTDLGRAVDIHKITLSPEV